MDKIDRNVTNTLKIKSRDKFDINKNLLSNQNNREKWS